MPLGPFDPIPPREKIKRSHINDLRTALTGIQDAYDVAVANGFVGTRAQWLASLKGEKGDPVSPEDLAAAVDAEIAGRTLLEGAPRTHPVLVLRPGASADRDGAVTPTNVGGVTTTSGAYGDAWRFDTVGQRIQIGNSGYVAPNAGTVLLRAKFLAALPVGQSQSILNMSGGSGLALNITRSTAVTKANYLTFAAGASAQTAGEVVPDNTFVTIALSWGPAGVRGYVDGVPVIAPVAYTGPATAMTTIYAPFSGATYPYQVESTLVFAEQLPDEEVARLAQRAAAHSIDTWWTTGVNTIEASHTAIVPAGAGASTLELRARDSSPGVLGVTTDGRLTVNGVVATSLPQAAITVTRAGASLTITSDTESGPLAVRASLAGSSNGAFAWGDTRLGDVFVHSTGDDVSPMVVNGTTIGGNHGYVYVSSYVVAGHGKTSADLGSIYTDGTRQYTLLRISGTTLVFGHPYTEADGLVFGTTTPPAATLTHVSGGTATAAVPITTPGAVTQLYPSVRDVSVTCALDGVPLTADGDYAGDALVVREAYTILDYKGIIDWAQSHVGTSYAGQAGVPGLLRVERTYTFGAGTCVTATTLVALRTLAMGYYNAHQSAWLAAAGHALTRHMPGVVPKSGYAFGTTEVDMTGYATTILYGPGDLTVPGEPPSWYVDWLSDGGSRVVGFAAGLLPDKGAGADTARAAANPAVDMRNTKKLYIRTCVDEVMAAGDIRTVHAFRAYLDPADVGDAAALATVGDASGDYVMASYLTSQVGAAIAAAGPGRVVTPLKGAGLTAGDTVGGDGIAVTVPSTGHATLKVTP